MMIQNHAGTAPLGYNETLFALNLRPYSDQQNNKERSDTHRMVLYHHFNTTQRPITIKLRLRVRSGKLQHSMFRI